MKTVILAAGTGSRLIHLTRERPKALVEVRGKPLIQYALDFANGLNSDGIVVVGGFYFEKLQKYLAAQKSGITLIENNDFLAGNIFTLIKALPHIDEDFLLMNVDHIFPLELARNFLALKSTFSRVTALVDFDRPLQEDDMKVLTSDKRTVAKISKTLLDYDAGYIGMTYVPQAKLAQYKAVAKSVAANNDAAVVEHILQQLIHSGEPVNIFSATGIRWLEVDNLQDLKNAERILKWVDGYLD